jgi:predicted Zn-dependent protease with MMP-like domain
VLATLAVHAAGGFEDILRVEALEGAGLQNLLDGVFRDHHPLRRVRHRQWLAQSPVDYPHYPPPRARTRQEPQRPRLLSTDDYEIILLKRAAPGSVRETDNTLDLPCTIPHVKKQDFYEMVEGALEGLPPELVELLDNVAIVVEDWPEYSTPLAPNEDNVLYGLYEGVPLTERGAGYHGFLPDKITIFQGPLERDFPQDELEEQVRITVVHEIAHYFGFDESRIEELGWG